MRPIIVREGSRRKRALALISIALRFLFALMLLSLPAAGQDAAEKIRAQINKYQPSLQSVPENLPGFGNVRAYTTEQLKSAAESVNAGRLYFSLEQLSRVIDIMNGLHEVSADPEAAKNAQAFEAVWEKTKLQLSHMDQQSGDRSWGTMPAAVRALEEIARGKMMSLLDGSRGFVVAVEPKAGLFNMGEARGQAEFAELCGELNLKREKPALPLRSLLPELAALQEKTNAAFQPPRSVDQHPLFIMLNSTLKLAEEFDSRKFYAGALYEYLMAEGLYAMLDAPTPPAEKRAELEAAISAARKSLENSDRDDSIAELLLERAESQIIHADGSAPNDNDRRAAKVSVEQVLPAYLAVLKAPAPAGPAPAKHIEITLVRWPDT